MGGGVFEPDGRSAPCLGETGAKCQVARERA
jgi:hypothetical protein